MGSIVFAEAPVEIVRRTDVPYGLEVARDKHARSAIRFVKIFMWGRRGFLLEE